MRSSARVFEQGEAAKPNAPGNNWLANHSAPHLEPEVGFQNASRARISRLRIGRAGASQRSDTWKTHAPSRFDGVTAPPFSHGTRASCVISRGIALAPATVSARCKPDSDPAHPSKFFCAKRSSAQALGAFPCFAPSAFGSLSLGQGADERDGLSLCLASS
eukprot:scaffold2321_cov245-Pinguiococcus_pyrenoidosus.AAC.6